MIFVYKRYLGGIFMIMVLCMLSLGCNGPAGFSPLKFYSAPDLIALCKAVESGDTDEIDRLVDAGVDLNAEGKENMRPLFFALLAKNKQTFEHLLKKGANPNIFSRDRGLIHVAARAENDSEWLEILLKHGADPNLTYKRFDVSKTPLYEAMWSRQRRNLELLIQAGADIDFQDEAGATLLRHSAGFNWFDTTYYLLEAGADFRLKTKRGYDLSYDVMRQAVFHPNDPDGWRQKVIDFLEKEGVDLEPARKKAEEEYQKQQEEIRKRNR